MCNVLYYWAYTTFAQLVNNLCLKFLSVYMPFHCFFLSWWRLWNFEALNVRNFVSIFCFYAWPVLILHNAYRGTWRLLPSLKKSLVTAHGLTTIISLSVVMQHRCLWITCRSEPQQHTDGTLKRCEWSEINEGPLNKGVGRVKATIRDDKNTQTLVILRPLPPICLKRQGRKAIKGTRRKL